MPTNRITVTVENRVAVEIDRLVTVGHYPNRGKVVQAALQVLLRGTREKRLAAECAKLDPQEEQAWAACRPTS